MGKNDQSRYLTSGEAGEMLGVSGKTVDRWADAGRIACAVTLGKHRRFTRDEVIRVAALMGTSPSGGAP